MARLPILMYHDVSSEISEGLTISRDKLEEQFGWLSEQGFRTWHLRELQDLDQLPKGKNIVITFDDAYVSFHEHVAPLLQKYNLKATLFVPLGYLGRTDEWNTGKVPIMTIDQLATLDPNHVELGYHSFAHGKFDELPLEAVSEDTKKCLDLVHNSGHAFANALAYPYGKFPREKTANEAFTAMLKEHGMHFGLRIGNRINSFPFPDTFQIQRLDIKGEYSLSKFRRKIRYGKLF